MDPDLAFAICRTYKLSLPLLEQIYEARSLLACKIPGLANMKDLYKVYQAFGKKIWAEANEFAEQTISLPDPHENERRYGSKKNLPSPPRANALHLAASFPGAEKFKSLADVGSWLAIWFIEDMAYFVVEDYEQNKDEPFNGQFAKIWAPFTPEEEMHTMTGWNEAFVRKLNRLLGA